MDTTDRCENSLQTLIRWFWGLLSVFAVVALVGLVIYGTVWLLVNMVVAVVIMVGGVIQSIRANKTGEKPLVTDKCLYTVFYLFALPITFLLFGLGAAWGQEVFVYGAAAYKITVMFTAYVVLREFILPLLMRRSSRTVHTVTAAALALVLWPVYAMPLHKLGVPMMIYDLANSAFTSI
jgi:hypothetical protein